MNNATPKLPTDTHTHTNTNTHAHSHTHTAFAAGSRLVKAKLTTCRPITFGAITLAHLEDGTNALISASLKFKSLLSCAAAGTAKKIAFMMKGKCAD